MQNLGIIIGRFSPLHIGHISLVNYSLKNHDKTIVIIGSAEKIDKNNPYSYNERNDIIKKEFDANIILDYLNDYEKDENWIGALNSVIKKYSTKEDNLYFLGGDLKNDFAIKVIKEHIQELDFNTISFIEKPRQEIPISATKIRNLLKEKNYDETEKWLSEKTVDLIIKKIV
ncbi:MAG: adenylyltransferase/cytidyltransferase family protein [Candidatus Gracilibacteria bacterium]